MSEGIVSYWCVTGREPVQFSIPVKVVDRNYRLLEVRVCTVLLKIQEKLLHSILSPISHVGEKDGEVVWMVSESSLSRVATKTSIDSVDPESLLMWGRVLPLTSRVDTSKVADRDAFVSFCASMGVGTGEEWCQFVWAQFCKLMAEWLVIRDKPLDLGFAKLHNCPMREDWKSIMTWCFPGIKNIERPRVIRSLSSVDLLDMSSSGHCIRRLEVELKPAWYKMTSEIEQERYNRLGPHDYARSYIRSITRRGEHWIKIFAAWTEAIRRPCAVRHKGDAQGEQKLVPDFRADKMYWKGVVVHNIYNLLSARFGVKGFRRISDNLPEADGSVPEVPDLESDTEDLRSAEGYLAQPSDSKT